MAKNKFLLALEGGGTRSQAALLDREGRVLHVSVSSDVNTNFVTFEQSQQAVLNAVNGALEAAGVSGEDVSRFVSALVGPRFGAETFGEVCPHAAYHYYSEKEVVFARAGIYRPHGVGVVAATGATAFGIRADDGREVMMGGWGSLLGDEGSAFAMGLMALRSAVRVFEGRDETPTRLIEAICRHYEIEPDNFRRGLVYLAYQKPLSRAEIGGLAAVVTGLAAQGDEAALRITAKVAGDLAALAMYVVRRLFDPAETFDVVVAGGLTNAGDLVLGPLRSQMAQAFPNAAIKIGVGEPAAALGRLALFDSPVDSPSGSPIEEE